MVTYVLQIGKQEDGSICGSRYVIYVEMLQYRVRHNTQGGGKIRSSFSSHGQLLSAINLL